MDKPQRFTHLFAVTRNLPYVYRSSHWSGPSLTGGVLGKGTAIWVEGSPTPRPPSMPAWIEDIGEVALDGRCIVSLTAETPQRMTQLEPQQPSVRPHHRPANLIQFP